jgi:hypothetical protein
MKSRNMLALGNFMLGSDPPIEEWSGDINSGVWHYEFGEPSRLTLEQKIISVSDEAFINMDYS